MSSLNFWEASLRANSHGPTLLEGRRILFTVAMASIRRTRNGKEINPVLRDFYSSECVNKKKKVALVVVMHKFLHYIFAVLRDQKPFEFRRPEDHQSWRKVKLQPEAA